MSNKRKKFKRLEKDLKVIKKELLIVLSKDQKKNNEMPSLPAVITTAPSKPKSFMPTAKSVMDARVAKTRAGKKPGFKNN